MRGSRIFFRVGPGSTARKQSGQRFLVLSLFYSLSPRGSNGFITKKTVLFQGSIGGPTFSRGGDPTFSRVGGVQMLISIETQITCDFVGGGSEPLPPPPPPLDPHMVCICLGICL